MWLIKGLGIGGAERLLVAHARYGNLDHFEYEVAFLAADRQHLVPELEEYDVPSYCLNIGRHSDPRWVFRLRRRLAAHPVDVLHIHSPYPAALVRPLVRGLPREARPAVVYTEHNRWDRYSRMTRYGNRATFSLNDHVIAVSADTRSSIAPHFRSRTEILEHGIDVDQVASQASLREEVRSELLVAADEVLIGIVANLSPKKGYKVLLEAVARMDSSLPVRFVSIGSGPDEALLRQRHSELNLGDRFRFLGYRSDATRLMAGFDVFTLSSFYEGLPVALMEALAMALPVVATRAGGIPEAITHNSQGLLVPPGDPGRLASALECIARDRDLRRRMAAAAGATAMHFDASRTVARLEDIYRSVARPPRTVHQRQTD